jgi:hypothetical protein
MKPCPSRSNTPSRGLESRRSARLIHVIIDESFPRHLQQKACESVQLRRNPSSFRSIGPRHGSQSSPERSEWLDHWSRSLLLGEFALPLAADVAYTTPDGLPSHSSIHALAVSCVVCNGKHRCDCAGQDNADGGQLHQCRLVACKEAQHECQCRQ